MTKNGKQSGIGYRMTPQEKEQLLGAANQRGVSPSSLVREALRRYVAADDSSDVVLPDAMYSEKFGFPISQAERDAVDDFCERHRLSITTVARLATRDLLRDEALTHV